MPASPEAPANSPRSARHDGPGPTHGMPSPDDASSNAAARTRRIVTLVVLFAIAIPWWWSFFPVQAEHMVLGAPLWFISAVAGSVLVSIYTAISLLGAWAELPQEHDNA